MARYAETYRITKETEVKAQLDLDGEGKNNIQTPAFFFNHMLNLFSRHSLFNLDIEANGDVEVDFHHLVEDIGIVLGECFLKAVGNKEGIHRYGNFYVPMDEALAFCSVDISGRPYLFFDASFNKDKVGEFDVELVEEFFTAFASSARITLHLEMIRGKNTHHIIEALFKAFGRALRQAVSIDSREKGVPSTKGVL
ncbi:MAG TPA: imidazoleglycerol-phosphate dehydratase HisB [Thermoanaerobacterales bacterium]|jgi:imidazoleglycerol-phosphate dehydratase|nr:imidazoleglycerol-phosphate dehydratase HisB [Thermoanaerobacterales bacterium]